MEYAYKLKQIDTHEQKIQNYRSLFMNIIFLLDNLNKCAKKSLGNRNLTFLNAF